ncbi:Uncharacterised protein [Mycobacteroides abscessus subsp. abscessus]|nr:Uncharacterised protein [Mycobacteroides abscessus]SHZ22053.1 Uncharacterised protein [Mycobacteroides abscessus subsp. abscessus]SIF43277.1 Uncharacterised protein [Mycobacteroides abscessus subsp. abscessus]SIM48513.1 Uncharacterised protein [Mycobacteroides abscessus subsp. abscessus]SKQ97998.1 Uncharacterised protein [Mycobacteroides abscessus subsp. abscessus]
MAHLRRSSISRSTSRFVGQNRTSSVIVGVILAGLGEAVRDGPYRGVS